LAAAVEIVTEIIVFLSLGLVTGFLSGLFGIGGGFIRIPIFAYVFPMIGVAHPILMHVAIATSVALIIPTAIAASIKQYTQGNLDLSFYSTWAIGIFVGVLIGLFLVPYISTQLFQIIFVVLALIIAAYLGLVKDSLVISKNAPKGFVKALISMSIGLASALTGTAGGALTTPALKVCSMPLKKAIGTASATGLVIGLVSTIGFVIHGWNIPDRTHFSFGYVNLVVFFAMLPSIFWGASLGARINNRLDDRIVKRAFALLMLTVAANFIFKLAADGSH
jgi:uncharacterized protein